jgi:hypothetical protein
MLVDPALIRARFGLRVDAPLAEIEAALATQTHEEFMRQRFPQASMPGFTRLDSLGPGYPASTGPVPTGRPSSEVGRSPGTGSPWARVVTRPGKSQSTVIRDLLAGSSAQTIGY